MTTRRDGYLDALRGGSLVVVVLWHWGLTMLVWRGGAPHATSPLAYTPGLWIFTWVLQVMPLFFFVGGAVHLASWRRARDRGEPLGGFVRRRLGQLAVPGLAVVLLWVVIAAGLASRYGASQALGAAKLVLSPLWFLAAYLLLVALLPVALWLHERLGVRGLLLLAGLAAATDLARVGMELRYAGWLNLVFVWGLAHQAGLHWEQLITASRLVAVGCAVGGLVGLTALVAVAGYPGSMVGVPGDRWSNMAPPTLAIVGLLAVQAGLVALLRPAAERLLSRPRWQAGVRALSRYALGLFLLHTTGMAAYRSGLWVASGGGLDVTPPDLAWWLWRPVHVAGALLFTVPLVAGFVRWQAPVPADRSAALGSAALPAGAGVHGEDADQPSEHAGEAGPQPAGTPG